MTEPAAALRNVAGTGARQARLSPQLRELHRFVLRHFLDEGAPPGSDWLAERAVELGLDPATAIPELARADLVHFADGAVVVAYPFSGVPTPHTVRLFTGVEVYSMCALDSLGIPPMTGLDVVVDSVDPVTGEPVRVSCTRGRWHWVPASTIVLIARVEYCGPIHTCSCPHMNFHTRRENAQAYLAEYPELAGIVLDQRAAVTRSRDVFGGLLGR
jgi:Alkylmercury lyase